MWLCYDGHYPAGVLAVLGPAMSPMLPTCYALLKTGAFLTDLSNYAEKGR